MNLIQATIRNTKTKGELNTLRKNGDVPGIIYGGENTNEKISLSKKEVKNLVVTDTIDNSDKVKKSRNIEVLSISNLLAEAMKRISNSTSVSDLFK